MGYDAEATRNRDQVAKSFTEVHHETFKGYIPQYPHMISPISSQRSLIQKENALPL